MVVMSIILSLLQVQLLLLFLTTTLHLKTIHCTGQKKLPISEFHNLQQEERKLDSSTCSLHYKSRTESGATTLELKHLGHCNGGITNWNKKMQEQIALDDLRVRSIQSRNKNVVISRSPKDVSDSQVPLTSGIELETLNYIVTVEIGGQKKTVIVDTGSDLTWVQCQPCASCYNQREPIFNTSSSPTYQPVQCVSSLCQSLQSASGNSGVCENDQQTCNYAVDYGDGSYTQGELGVERIGIGNMALENFVFGCGRDNKGLFGGASGLMGLGRSKTSLVSQTEDIFGGVFSYCLPSALAGASGSLVLGTNSSVYNISTPISFTRMLPDLQLPTFYFLNLTGMAIGGVDLQVPIFGRRSFLIDSGTVITRLPPSIYKAMKEEFLKQCSRFPSAPSYSILETCFDLSSYKEVEIPTIKMQFEGGGEIDVDVSGIFYFVKSDASLACLALASLEDEEEIGIVGNYQQRNQRVIYDTKESKLGFAKENCSFTQ